MTSDYDLKLSMKHGSRDTVVLQTGGENLYIDSAFSEALRGLPLIDQFKELVRLQHKLSRINNQIGNVKIMIFNEIQGEK